MYLICDFDETLVINNFVEEQFFKLFLAQPWMIVKYGLQSYWFLYYMFGVWRCYSKC